MKRILPILLILLLLCGCAPKEQSAQIAATTKPIAQFAREITNGSGLTVTALITEPISCLHDYSLSVGQMETAQKADIVLLSGGGLEDTMAEALERANAYDCSQGLPLLTGEDGDDPHYWLDPDYALAMAENIADALSEQYPQHAALFAENLQALYPKFEALWGFIDENVYLSDEIITFHDGFAYFADALGLTVLAAMETEPGSEVSAGELSEIIALVREYDLPCVFTEENGAQDAANIVAQETGCKVYTLTTCLSDDDYFEAMRKNIATISEALS